jgi:hypothetical protein
MESINKLLVDEICGTNKKKDQINACIENGILDDLFEKYRRGKNYFQIRKILIFYLDKLSPEAISTLSKRMWELVSCNVELSEDFIRKYSEKLNWECISWYQILSEDLIRQFKDKVCWDYISCRQTLSQDFMREFSNKINWEHITQTQDISGDFMHEFKDKIDWINVPLCKVPFAAEFYNQYV